MDSCFLFIVAMSLAVCYSARVNPMRYTSSELEILTQKEIMTFLDSLPTKETVDEEPVKQRLLRGFVYENCAKPSREVVVVSGLAIKPDPVKTPGNVTVSFDAVIKSKFGAPLTAKLTVYKKIFGVYIKIPCIDNIGSCTYHKICRTVRKAIKTCPPVFLKQGLKCQCPFLPAKASIKNFTMPLKLKIPSVVSGGVRVKIELTSGSTYITCMQITMDIA